MEILGMDTYGLACVFLTGIIVTCLIMLFEKKKPRGRHSIKDDFNGEDVPSLELNRKEFYKTVNFMLMYGIITNDQYNELTMKSLAYVKR